MKSRKFGRLAINIAGVHSHALLVAGDLLQQLVHAVLQLTQGEVCVDSHILDRLHHSLHRPRQRLAKLHRTIAAAGRRYSVHHVSHYFLVLSARTDQAKDTLTGKTTCEVVISGLMRTRRLAAKRKSATSQRALVTVMMNSPAIQAVKIIDCMRILCLLRTGLCILFLFYVSIHFCTYKDANISDSV